MSDSVIRALLTALEAAPDDLDLRRHVASILVESDPAAALEHLRVVLGAEPDDLAALAAARDAAVKMGDESLAGRYARLLAALGGADRPAPATDEDSPAAVTSDGAPAAVTSGGLRAAEPSDADPGDEFDEFLREVLDEDARTRVRLSDVAGLADVKQRLELGFLGPLRSPELRAHFGTSVRGGMLLYGPPGCGKTYLARALAGELDAAFVPVLLNDVLDMWLGNSEKRLHELFDMARRKAPSVIFFDEVDAIGRRRSDLGASAGRNVISQLLTELDGMAGSNDDVFVLGATNQPWDVDAALRRPGRFDRTLLVLPPDRPARLAILQQQLHGRPTESVDLDAIAAGTDGYSGADLRLLCETALQLALEASVSAGRVVPVSDKHLKSARKQTRATTASWFDIARNAAYFANQDGSYDELIAYLERRR